MSRKIWQRTIALTVAFTLFMSSIPVVSAQDGDGAGNQIYLPQLTNNNGAADADVISEDVSVEDQEAALSYWTHERISAATAMQITVTVQAEPAEVASAAQMEPEVAIPVDYREPLGAAADADQVAQAAYPEDWVEAEVSVEDEAALEAEVANVPDSTSATTASGSDYTSYIANWLSAMQKEYPHRWMGVFTFTAPDGPKLCTATAISGNNIVTAAHCVYDTASRNKYYTNRAFTPAYRNWSAPYGTFAVRSCSILPAWQKLSGKYDHEWALSDVAVCTVGRNSAGQTLNAAVGAVGIRFDAALSRHIFTLGYAGQDYAKKALTWPSQYLRLCSGQSSALGIIKSVFPLKIYHVRRMGCNWGPGMSGGPWIDNSSSTLSKSYGTNGYWPGLRRGRIVGVTSGGFNNEPTNYGINFSSNNIGVLCTNRGC